MDVELVNYINFDIKWNPVKKRTTRFPRNPGADCSQFGNKIQDPSVFEIKSGVDVIGRHFSEKVSYAPLKKRRLLRQSPSPPPPLETQCRSNSPLKRMKNKVSELDDFSGIELLAAAACSSLIHDKTDHIEFSMVEEHTKETLVTIEPDNSSVKDSMVPNTHDNEDRRAAPSKGVKFHWDLNTVMDEWEEPCTEGVFNGESSASKSDLVDSSIHQEKHEDFSTSNTSVLQKQNTIKGESETIQVVQDGFQSPKLFKSYSHKNFKAEDPLSDGCGSNVTQDEQGHMADRDTLDNIQAGYDSPFEDGELRERADERDRAYYESDNINEDDFGTVEYPLSEKRTVKDQNSSLVKEVEEKLQVDTIEKNNGCELKVDASDCGPGKVFFERKNGCDESTPLDGNSLHIDGSTAFDVCRNDVYVRRSRSSNIGYSFSRAARDLGPEKFTGRENIARSLDNNQSRNYNRKNDTYTLHKFHPQELHETRRFLPNFNRPARRSRSGSPIAWNFQKRRNFDKKKHEATRPPFQKPSDRKFMIRERLKAEDHFRFAPRFPKDDNKYGTFRYGGGDRVVPESTSTTSKEKGSFL